MRIVEPVKHYGFYSPTAAMEHGYTVYRTPYGDEVRVTCVTTDPEGSAYWWDDKEKVGEVLAFVRNVEHARWPWN
jgi:hypothetical protein